MGSCPAVPPFALNSFGIAATGACPITITTASDRLSSLGGAVGIAIAGTGYTSYGGTVTKALNQFVFGERDRLVPATTTLLAKGIGAGPPQERAATAAAEPTMVRRRTGDATTPARR